MLKKPLVLLSLIVALALLVGGFVLAGDHNRTDYPTGVIEIAHFQPVSMVGSWDQTSGMNDVTMAATVSPDGTISILMNGEPYWAGSFKTTSSASIVSKADGDPQLSQDSSKTFTYNNGDLSFPFSILGQTATVHLQRSSK